jgi:uncharacterized protein with HEPN domain
VRPWWFLQLETDTAACLGKAFHEPTPETTWTQIVAMRNVLVHEYFEVVLQEVWKTV